MYILKSLLVTCCLILFPMIANSEAASNSTSPRLLFKINTESLVLDKANIKSARLIKHDDGFYGLDLELTEKGAKELTRITSSNIGKVMSVFYNNDQLISQATIQSALGDKVLIARFPEKEGNELIGSLITNQSPH